MKQPFCFFRSDFISNFIVVVVLTLAIPIFLWKILLLCFAATWAALGEHLAVSSRWHLCHDSWSSCPFLWSLLCASRPFLWSSHENMLSTDHNTVARFCFDFEMAVLCLLVLARPSHPALLHCCHNIPQLSPLLSVAFQCMSLWLRQQRRRPLCAI